MNHRESIILLFGQNLTNESRHELASDWGASCGLVMEIGTKDCCTEGRSVLGMYAEKMDTSSSNKGGKVVVSSLNR